MEKILLAEDDPAILRTLIPFLEGEGFQVTGAATQEEAISALEEESRDLALLDIALARGSGFAVCAAAKALGVPVIFLTASADEYSVVTGLDMGADDYVSKPFRPRELVSRIRSVLRRSGRSRTVFHVGRVTVDTEKGTATREGRDLYLSALEYRLLLVFLNHRGMILTRDRLLEEIWDSAGEFVEDNTLTVYMKRLREKIEDNPREPRLIVTVRGAGYRLENEP